MAQLRRDHFSPTRYMERIENKNNTSNADGPDLPPVPIKGCRRRFGKMKDVLKMRMNTWLRSGNGMSRIAAEEAVFPQELRNVRIMTKKPAFRSGGDFIGALFNV